jgi:antitoxin CcdA
MRMPMRIEYAPHLPGKAMTDDYNRDAPKKATNLSINADLLSKARELEINLSATLEHALVESLKRKRRERWLAENKGAINGYNEHVETHGAFSDGLRSF